MFSVIILLFLLVWLNVLQTPQQKMFDLPVKLKKIPEVKYSWCFSVSVIIFRINAAREKHLACGGGFYYNLSLMGHELRDFGTRVEHQSQTCVYTFTVNHTSNIAIVTNGKRQNSLPPIAERLWQNSYTEVLLCCAYAYVWRDCRGIMQQKPAQMDNMVRTGWMQRIIWPGR